MVFVNDKKYACETCIKGHRSSTCNHTERPLFEIKKKGRPVTQCEHCRELRKTKQVHVKCVCEGKDDLDAISHSIPAKKANRKGPPPSAAFPFGLQSISAPASDSEDASDGFTKAKASQKSGDSPSCACKNTGGPCHCCIPRHLPRVKRSATPPMPRPWVGDIRPALPPALIRPSSDPGDAFELSQRSLPIEPEPHVLVHGHGARPTHGSALFSPYGHAHDAHLRAHDTHGHEASTSTLMPDASNGYIYPVPPIPYSQQQAFAARSEPSLVWPNGERLSEDVNTLPSTCDAQASEYQSDLFGAVDFGSVDVDAWLREMMACNSDPQPTEPDSLSSQPPSANAPFTNPRTDPQALPVPQSLDVSHDLVQAQDPDYAQASNQFDLLPGFGNIDIDFNDNYLSGSEQDVGNANELPSAEAMFDSDVFNFTTSETSSVQEVRERAAELLGAISGSLPAPAAPPQPPILAVQGSGGDNQYASSVSSTAGPKPQSQAQEYGLDYFLEPDYVVRPDSNVPPLTRSSSVGSHSSVRSRSSMGMSHWAQNRSSDCVVSANTNDQWANAATENSWSLSSFPDTGPGWPASRVRSFAMERGRALSRLAAMDLSLAKDNSAPHN